MPSPRRTQAEQSALLQLALKEKLLTTYHREVIKVKKQNNAEKKQAASANRQVLEEAEKTKNVMNNYTKIIAFREGVTHEIQKSVSNCRLKKAFAFAWVSKIKATQMLRMFGHFYNRYKAIEREKYIVRRM